MGVGFGAIGLIFGLLCAYKPDLAIFKRYEEKQLWQAQGVFLTAGGFGRMFLLLGLKGKPWNF